MTSQEPDPVSRPPFVSVVMGVYNGEAALPMTLDSIFNQQDIDFECVVIDDGSSDSTWGILEERVKIEPRLRTYRQGRGGLTRALINGCAAATGDYIARHDVGDVSLPLRLSKQVAALERNPRWSFISCQWELLGPQCEHLAGPNPIDGGLSIRDGLRSGHLSRLACPQHGSVMMRRSAYEAAGGYRKEFYFAQDLDLWTRLIEIGDMGFVNEILYQASFTQDCISAKHRESQQQLKTLIAEAIRLRRSRQPEDDALEVAASIRPGELDESDNRLANYFIASCLFQQSDPRARAYLRKSVEANPGDLKAWAKLGVSYLLHR